MMLRYSRGTKAGIGMLFRLRGAFEFKNGAVERDVNAGGFHHGLVLGGRW
jgi:hypothetical protein